MKAKEQIKYAIYFDYKTLGQWDGKKELQAVTNNPKKWLEEHNSDRCEESQESLSDFVIEELCGEDIYDECEEEDFAFREEFPDYS